LQCFQPNHFTGKPQDVKDFLLRYTLTLRKIFQINLQLQNSNIPLIIHFHKNDSHNIKDDEVGTIRNIEFQTGTNKWGDNFKISQK
jgi:hypothetical protein